MAKFIVKVLEVQGINKKIYKAGESVETANFPEGIAEKLCNDGFLAKSEESAKAEKPEKKDKLKLEEPGKAEK